MLRVLKSGFYTTIQDSGRFGYRAFGVPVSGAMDSYSSHFANAILGNKTEDAVLEITMSGPKLQFQDPTQIAIAGAEMGPKLNDKPVTNNVVFAVKPDDVLSFSGLKFGFRCYLAVKGGFQSDELMGSRSMYLGITDFERIKDGDELNYQKHLSNSLETNSNVKYVASIIESNIVEVYKGPEYDVLTRNQKDKINALQFEVSKFNNRMAYQLRPLLSNNLKSIITSPVLPGTVQLTPAGNLIVLMRDCQTTGGYPRVLQLRERSLNILSQKRQGDELVFRLNA